MTEYRTLFDGRGARYNHANRKYPLARAEEASALLAHWNAPSGGPWLDVGAGGGFLAQRAAAEGMTQAAYGCDESPAFLWEASGYALRVVTEYVRLPFPGRAFAAAACLAVLHHAEDPGRVVAEMLRVTASDGRVVVGDVVAGSRAARFLNGFVDAHTEQGHAGRFYEPRTLAEILERAGGRGVRSEEAVIHWRFATRSDGRAFFQELFGLRAQTRPDEIDEAQDELGLVGTGAGWELRWAMVFASATAP